MPAQWLYVLYRMCLFCYCCGTAATASFAERTHDTRNTTRAQSALPAAQLEALGRVVGLPKEAVAMLILQIRTNAASVIKPKVCMCVSRCVVCRVMSSHCFDILPAVYSLLCLFVFGVCER